LTFSTTSPSIEAAKGSHGLSELTSNLQPGTEARRLFVLPAVRQFLENPPANFVPMQFAKIHERYVLNQVVVASIKGTSNKAVMFERMWEVDEVWMLCVRKPGDGQWRFFGRFVEPGLFVILLHKSRLDCGTIEQFKVAIAEFKAKWDEVFGDASYATGETCEVFFGEMVSDYDSQ
jgi:hypothetical protein